MNQNTVMLLLNVLSSPSTVLTEAQMLGVLELSGIVKNPNGLKAMQFAAGLTSSATPATLLGFVGTLQGLIKLNPDSNPADYASLEAYLKQVASTGSDVPLTFGMLLPLLASMPSHPLTPKRPAPTPRTEKKAGRRERKTPTAAA